MSTIGPMYRVTRVLSVGPFASPERAERLLAAGVTHVLNVCDGPCVVSAGAGSFREVAWVPMLDSVPLRHSTAVEVLDVLHGMACEPGAHVYVHCMAGHLRSPTVLWLYLIACGLPPDDARDLIETASPVATAGYPLMVTPSHVLLAQRHGQANFFPHPRGDVLRPFEEAE
jgi:hypothetical protein